MKMRIFKIVDEMVLLDARSQFRVQLFDVLRWNEPVYEAPELFDVRFNVEQFVKWGHRLLQIT